MRLLELGLAGAILIAAQSAVAATGLLGDYPGAGVQACLKKIHRLSDDGDSTQTHDLHRHCPELAARLLAAKGRGHLGGLENGSVSVDGLRDVYAFNGGFDAHRELPADVTLDYVGLEALLSEVLIDEHRDEGWWKLFLQWLQDKLGEGESGDFQWLVDWLEKIQLPDWLAEVVFQGSIVLIVLLAIVVIGNELRVAGLFRRSWRRRRSGELPREGKRPRARGARSLDEIRSLPHKQLAAAVLTLVIETLSQRGWVSATKSFTNGELVGQLSERHGALSEPFRRLVRAVEMVVYGGRDPDEGARVEILGTADVILERSRINAEAAKGRPA